jgi:hypothetical protein
MSGIALCAAYNAAGRQVSEERDYFREALYFSLLIAHMDIKEQNTYDHPWLARNATTSIKTAMKVREKLRKLQDELIQPPKV